MKSIFAFIPLQTLFLLLLSIQVVNSESLCRFYSNGQYKGKAVEVDLDESRVVAQLQHSLLPLAKLLNLIRFDAPSEFELFNQTGFQVKNFLDCPKHNGKLYVIRKGDLWIYPAQKIKTEVQKLENNEPKINDVSHSPRIITLENLFTPKDLQNFRRCALEQIQKSNSSMITMSLLDFEGAEEIQSKIATALRLPEDLLIQAIIDIQLVSAKNESSKGKPIQTIRPFYIRRDYEQQRKELDKGRNVFLTAIIPLTQLKEENEGEFFFPIHSDMYLKLVQTNDDGTLGINVDPSLRACQKDHGLLVQQKVGSPIVVYTLDSQNQMFGLGDSHSIYQHCNPIGSDQLTLTIRIFNKIWYSSDSLLLGIFDSAFQFLFGGTQTFSRGILMNGYGWDWHENPHGDYPHSIPDLKGKFRLVEI